MVFPGTYPNLNPKARPRVRVRIRIQGLKTIKQAIKMAVKNERQRGKRKPEKSSEYIDSPAPPPLPPKKYEKSSQQKSAITNLFFSYFQPNQPTKKVQKCELENKSNLGQGQKKSTKYCHDSTSYLRDDRQPWSDWSDFFGFLR